MSWTVANLYRYVVKGLSAQALAAVDLRPQRGIDLDRAFGLALTNAAYDAGRPQWLPKENFVTLAAHERVAALDVHYDEGSGVLAIRRAGKPVARGAVATPIGRAMLEEFFRAYLKNELAGPPKLVGSPDGPSFADHAEAGVTLLGLGTIADIERVVGRPVDPLRFRANVYLAGSPPWAEFEWLGQEIALGTARLRIRERIECSAPVDVDPKTGSRDVAITQDLRRVFGHADCGILADVTVAGRVAIGDSCALLEP
jgi:uncharacterized protein YcbX